jgi:hypothetical protein
MTYQDARHHYDDASPDDFTEPVGPRVVCDNPDCRTDHGEHPAGTEVPCECGATLVAEWPPPAYEPTDEDVATYDAAQRAALAAERAAPCADAPRSAAARAACAAIEDALAAVKRIEDALAKIEAHVRAGWRDGVPDGLYPTWRALAELVGMADEDPREREAEDDAQ